MSKPSENSNNIWLSLEQLIKYVKGNLLGSKKQEVEDKITASPLLSDAAEGIKETAQPEKLQKVVDSLNRQIQLKTGASAVIAPTQDSQPSNSGTTKKLSGKAILSIAASVLILATAGAAIWWGLSTPSPTKNSAMLRAEVEQKVDSDVVPGMESHSHDFSQNDLAFDGDKTVTDSIAADTNQGLLAVLEKKNLDLNEADEELSFAEDDLSEEPVYDLANKSDHRYAAADRKDELNKERQQESPVATRALANSAEPIAENEESGENSVEEENKLYFNANTIEPNQANGYNNSTLDLEDAVVAKNDKYKKSALGTTDSDAYTEALALLDAGNLSEAETAFADIASNRNSAYQDDAYWNLAQIYLKQEDPKAAKRVLKKIKNSPKYGVKAKLELDKL